MCAMKPTNPWARKRARERVLEKKEAREEWRKLETHLAPHARTIPRHEMKDTSRCDCGHFWNDHGPSGCTLCPCTFIGVPV